MVRHVGVSGYIKVSQIAAPRPLILMERCEFITQGIFSISFLLPCLTLAGTHALAHVSTP